VKKMKTVFMLKVCSKKANLHANSIKKENLRQQGPETLPLGINEEITTGQKMKTKKSQPARWGIYLGSALYYKRVICKKTGYF